VKLRPPRLRRAGELCGLGLAAALAWRVLG